jgi:hypothetical protein
MGAFVVGWANAVKVPNMASKNASKVDDLFPGMALWFITAL